MFKKILEYSGFAALLVLLAVLFIPHTSSGKLGNSTASLQEADGGFYIGTQPIALNTGANYPTLFTSSIVNSAGGFTATISTSTALTAAQFCATANIRFLGSNASVTSTFPSATSTFVACGSGALGGWETQLVTNDSTNTVNFVPGAGMTFLCETQGVGTTTVVGGCTSSTVAINSASVVLATGFWDSGSSTMYIMWGNLFH